MDSFNGKLDNLVDVYANCQGDYLLVEQLIEISEELLKERDVSFRGSDGKAFMDIASNIQKAFLPLCLRGASIELIGCWTGWLITTST